MPETFSDASATFDRSVAPVNPAPIRAAFPKAIEHALPNGLKIYFHVQRESPLVNVRLYVRAGSVLEGDALKAASFAFALLPHGTLRRSAKEIADEIEFLGADLSSSASLDFGSVSLSMMSKHLAKGLELFADVALNPSFPESEVEFARQQSLSRLRFAKADAATLASEVFNHLIYAPHPYGNPTLGTVKSLNALTRAQIASFYETYFRPNRAFITVAGDFDPEPTWALLETLFGKWQAREVEEPTFEPPKPPSERRVVIVQKDGAAQSVLNIGHLAIPRRHDDFIPLYVGNMILGGYFGSRLNMNLREKQGFAYGIRSNFDAMRLAGDFNVATQVRTDVTGAAIEQILLEIDRLLNEGISEKELAAAKRYVAGNFVIQNESPSSIAIRLANVEIYDLPKSYYDDYIDAINALERQTVEDAMRRHLRPESFLFVIAGESQAVRAQAERFGVASVQDAEGNFIA
ncbi:MAG: pitrilysin family protein [Chloroherpetonaceae bacterium]|nr:pitrilysin family protein [Chloroherpetonaceae bacterium]